jgi:hypothetical protein
VQSAVARIVFCAAIVAFIAGDALAIDGFDGTSVLPPPTPRLAQAQLLYPQPDGTYYSPSGTCPPYCPTTVTPAPAAAIYTQPYDPYTAAPAATSCAWQSFCVGVFGEFTYWQPRGAEVAFAVPQNGIVLPGSTPTGPVGVVDPGFSPGFRAGTFVGLGPDSRVVGTYTWFHNVANATSTATAPDVINPLVLFPGTFNAGFTAEEATARLETNFQLIDIDYQAVGRMSNLGWWGYSLGGRYARLEQDFNATFPFAPPDGTTTLATDVTFDGIGPRVGLEGERIIFPRFGLRAYGKSSASFVVGRFQSNYTQTNEFGGVEVNTSLKSDRVVPILDLELGLAWLSPGQRIRISGGYMVAAWFNSITTSSWIDSVNNLSFQPGSDTLTFDGLTARAEVRF